MFEKSISKFMSSSTVVSVLIKKTKKVGFSSLTIVVDHAVAVHVCFFDHVLDLFFGQLLAQICHHATQLRRRYQSILVLIKDPAKWNLIIRQKIPFLMNDMKGISTTNVRDLFKCTQQEMKRKDVLVSELSQTRTIGSFVCSGRKISSTPLSPAAEADWN